MERERDHFFPPFHCVKNCCTALVVFVVVSQSSSSSSSSYIKPNPHRASIHDLPKKEKSGKKTIMKLSSGGGREKKASSV